MVERVKDNFMTINDINTLDSLKKYGSFKDVKKVLKKNCGFNIKSKSWKALFEKLQNIIKLINNSNKDLFITNSFLKSKNNISKILNIHSCANSINQLSKDFDRLIIFFTLNSFDPYKEFEKSKKLDFKYSSKLEGLDIKDTNKTLNEIIKQYKIELNG